MNESPTYKTHFQVILNPTTNYFNDTKHSRTISLNQNNDTQQSRTISLNQKIARLHTRPAAYTNQKMLNSH